MRRREFIRFLGSMAIAAPLQAIAQTSKIFRLGTLTVGLPIQPTEGTGAILIRGLAQRGMHSDKISPTRLAAQLARFAKWQT